MVPNFEALRQDPQTKVAAVASRWQSVGDLIDSKFEPHTSRTRSKRLTIPYSMCYLACHFRISGMLFEVANGKLKY